MEIQPHLLLGKNLGASVRSAVTRGRSFRLFPGRIRQCEGSTMGSYSDRNYFSGSLVV